MHGAVAAQHVAAWTPAALPGLAAWWDASDLATITAAAGKVSQWNDKSGAARHLTQPTGPKQPATGTRTINARNVLDFDGVDDVLSTAIVVAQPATYFVVAKYDVIDTTERKMFDGLASRNLLQNKNSGEWSAYAGAGLVGLVGTANTALHAHAVVIHGATSEWFLDGVSLGVMNLGTDPLDGITVGDYVGGGFGVDGALPEMAIASGHASPADITAWRDYCSSKWGIV